MPPQVHNERYNLGGNGIFVRSKMLWRTDLKESNLTLLLPPPMANKTVALIYPPAKLAFQ